MLTRVFSEAFHGAIFGAIGIIIMVETSNNMVQFPYTLFAESYLLTALLGGLIGAAVNGLISISEKSQLRNSGIFTYQRKSGKYGATNTTPKK